MSNTREIFPQQPVWTPNGNKNAKFLALTNFYDYHFDGGGGMVVYQLIGEQDNGTTTLDDGTMVQNPPSLTTLFQGAMVVPSNIVQQWGASDDIIFQYVATTLGLTLVPLPI